MISAHTQGGGGRTDRQRARMVGLRGLRYFAPQIGRGFFPHEDPSAQLLAAFGVFAIGYLMRPIGGAVFGHIGERLGRRTALTISIAATRLWFRETYRTAFGTVPPSRSPRGEDDVRARRMAELSDGDAAQISPGRQRT